MILPLLQAMLFFPTNKLKITLYQLASLHVHMYTVHCKQNKIILMMYYFKL